MFCIVFHVQNATFIGVSLKGFVIFFVSLLLYVKVAHLIFWCCRSVFMLCLCQLGRLVPRITLYLLLCSVSFMKVSSSSFASFIIGYLCTPFIRELILDILCSYGWRELFGIVISDGVCFLYIANSSFVFLRCIVRFRKSVKLCCSSSMVNFTLVCCLLNSAKVSSMFVFFWL
jgi:hypothetical protein